jgi:hypothetical protein
MEKRELMTDWIKEISIIQRQRQTMSAFFFQQCDDEFYYKDDMDVLDLYSKELTMNTRMLK